MSGPGASPASVPGIADPSFGCDHSCPLAGQWQNTVETPKERPSCARGKAPGASHTATRDWHRQPPKSSGPRSLRSCLLLGHGLGILLGRTLPQPLWLAQHPCFFARKVFLCTTEADPISSLFTTNNGNLYPASIAFLTTALETILIVLQQKAVEKLFN